MRVAIRQRRRQQQQQQRPAGAGKFVAAGKFPSVGTGTVTAAWLGRSYAAAAAASYSWKRWDCGRDSGAPWLGELCTASRQPAAQGLYPNPNPVISCCMASKIYITFISASHFIQSICFSLFSYSITAVARSTKSDLILYTLPRHYLTVVHV